MSDFAALLATLVQSRQTILPKRLTAPGPSANEFLQILTAAASAPDHGQLVPWRFIEVPASTRGLLAEQFSSALIDRDSHASPEQIAQAREKAFRAPTLMLVVVDNAPNVTHIELHERILSAGCAVQNMLLMATALGFGSALTSGKALKFEGFRQLFGLTVHDHPMCFISIGTALKRKSERILPVASDFTRQLVSVGKVVCALDSTTADFKATGVP